MTRKQTLSILGYLPILLLFVFLPAIAAPAFASWKETVRAAPPVAVSRVGCCDLSMAVYRSRGNRRFPVMWFRCRLNCDPRGRMRPRGFGTFVGLRLDGQRGLLVKVVGGARGVLRELAKNGVQTDGKTS